MSRRPIVVALLVVGVIALSVGVVMVHAEVGDPEPDAGGLPVTAALRRTTPASAPFVGLDAIKAEIGHDNCLRLVVADSLPERYAGLRGHAADLGPYDGMLFVFDAPSESSFTMSGVDSPLDIAFFDANGARTTTLAMKPCPVKADTDCPTYRADGPYLYAVETKGGQLPSGDLAACSPT
jgi:uncharacterized membrane protein (UPF0127 family)